MSSMRFTEGYIIPSVHFKVYEDKSGSLYISRDYKYLPRNKFLNMKLHHFRDYMYRREITIHKISTEYQTSDYLSKPLYEKTHIKHRKYVQGW